MFVRQSDEEISVVVDGCFWRLDSLRPIVSSQTTPSTSVWRPMLW